MQSRRDQVQAHLFMVGRLKSGILGADPDALEPPLARTSRGLFVGMILAMLGLVAFALFGLLFPGGSATWRNSRTLLIVKESGARYVYLDGTLHPVLNYASAVLLLGSTQTTQVSASALNGVPRGAPVGIPGAPDELPAAAKMGGDRSWRVCASQDGADSTPTTSVLIDIPGTPQALPTSQGVLVGVADDASYLLWYGRRYRLPGDRASLGVLGYADAPVRQVNAAFINAVPAGPDLAAPAVPGRGRDGPRIGGQPTKVGQLFVLASSGQAYVLTTGGLRPVTRTQYDLLLADPDTAKLAYGGATPATRPLDAGDLTTHADSARYDETSLPPTPPTLVRPGGVEAVCLLVQPAGDAPRYGFYLTDAGTLDAHPVTVPESVIPSCSPADQVAVGASGGALVRVLPAAGLSRNGRVYLITPAGIRYPMTSSGMQTLGYSSVTPTAIPHELLDALPTGPVLDAVQSGVRGFTVAGCM